MALSEKHRHSIHQHLAPQWGDEVTQAFLSQFPASEGEEPITRDYLRAELTGVRGELKVEIAAVDGRLGRFGSRLAGLIVGGTALILTGLGIATTVIVTQLN